MKVLHVYRTYYPDTQGGLEEVIRQICASTSELGAECRVFTTSSRPAKQLLIRPECSVVQTYSNIEIASCNISISGLKAFKEQADWADIIHYHFPWPFGDVLNMLTLTDAKKVVTYHSDIVRQKVLGFLYRPLMDAFLRDVDRIVCTSPNYFASSDVLARFSAKVSVIPIGISSDYVDDQCGDTSSEEGCNFGEDFFLFVGVLRYYKGLNILLEAVRGAPYNVVIVGAGPIESELRAQALDLKLDNVFFAGRVSDAAKHELFRSARGVVFPSNLRAEAFGVTLLEGAMHSLPMISTEVGSGTSNVNVHDQTGYVVPPSSPKALREAMDRLWYEKDSARRMGAQARLRYEELFTAERMGDRYSRLYRRLLDDDASAMDGTLAY